MGASTMRCFLSVGVAALIIGAACVTGLTQANTSKSQPSTYNLGSSLSAEEIRRFDFMIGPEGKELPAGSGTAKQGAEIYAVQCALCHGKNGRGGGPACDRGSCRNLVLGTPGNPRRGPFKRKKGTP